VLVSINILNINEKHYLGRCLEGVLVQTYSPLEITVLDNGSTDGSAEFVRQHFPTVRLVENGRNLGYCAAHNKAIALTKGELVMPLNADCFLTPTFVAEMVAAIEADEKIGAEQGKLLLVRPEVATGRPPEALIDTTGIIITKSRRNFDRGQGQRDNGPFSQPGEVFGASGAAPLYKRAMLEDIKIGAEYFDESFFLYREEVDLAWRARLRGWRCVYVPSAVAYHARRFSPATRRQQPRWLRRLSYRNRYLMLIKNDTWPNILRHLPHILAFEAAMLAYVFVREPHLLGALPDLLRLLPQAWRKRAIIQRRALAKPGEIARWFV